MRICVLDDDLEHNDFVTQTLTAAGHTCHIFTDARVFIYELRRQTYDLLVLDWNMPSMSGDLVLKWIREKLKPNLAVLFVTNRSFEADMVAMLNAGADDYIVKPVSRCMLLARVETILRRVYPLVSEEAHQTFGVYDFDCATQHVSVGGIPVSLTHKEFELALLLFRNLARPLSRTHIRETVWRRDVELPSRTMDTHISHIRSKLHLRPQNGYRIVPIYGYGYRFERVSEERS